MIRMCIFSHHGNSAQQPPQGLSPHTRRTIHVRRKGRSSSTPPPKGCKAIYIYKPLYTAYSSSRPGSNNAYNSHREICHLEVDVEARSALLYAKVGWLQGAWSNSPYWSFSITPDLPEVFVPLGTFHKRLRICAPTHPQVQRKEGLHDVQVRDTKLFTLCGPHTEISSDPTGYSPHFLFD